MKILKHHALNPEEVQKIANKPIRVIKYSQLNNYKHIEDLFGRIKCCLILYETSNNIGHWCCLINQPKKIVFFDPYALEPDDQLHFTNIKFREENDMYYPLLTYLLYNSKKPIDYNDKVMQKMDEKIVTCGYHCGFRMQQDKLTSDEYIKLFKNIPLHDRDNLIIGIGNKYIG